MQPQVAETKRDACTDLYTFFMTAADSVCSRPSAASLRAASNILRGLFFHHCISQLMPMPAQQKMVHRQSEASLPAFECHSLLK
jgi:hypothetical protein